MSKRNREAYKLRYRFQSKMLSCSLHCTLITHHVFSFTHFVFIFIVRAAASIVTDSDYSFAPFWYDYIMIRRLHHNFVSIFITTLKTLNIQHSNNTIVG